MPSWPLSSKVLALTVMVAPPSSLMPWVSFCRTSTRSRVEEPPRTRMPRSLKRTTESRITLLSHITIAFWPYSKTACSMVLPSPDKVISFQSPGFFSSLP